jgi:hypothetical protein
MTARVARISSVAAVLLTAACTNYYEIPIETPIRAKLDVGAFQRVLVAGFIAGGSEDVDGNLETTRLLRSQLRTKSELRVIDADVLPLMDVASDGRSSAEGSGGNGAGAPPAALPEIKDERDLDAYEHVFANVEYWKKIGEEYQQPLIVTGTVLFTPQQRNQVQQTEQEVYDNLGRRRTLPVRRLVERKGFGLSGRFIFIDGRTGATLHSQSFVEQVLYDASRQTPALSSYFELMDRLIPNFLATLSSQKIKGTRILLN